MAGGIRRIYLDVGDLAASLEFYREYLGFLLASQTDMGQLQLAVLQMGTMELWLREQRTGRRERTAGERGSGVVVGLDVAEVDQLCRELELRGVPPELPPHNAAWGERCALILDPDGYRIMLIQRNGP
jgi:catechol 2,3-dioxygenase-like lactoylglutathione lyase family enzyme